MLDAIKSEYFEGKIKTQNLETEIFVREYNSDPGKVAEACRTASELRCEFLEKKSGKSLKQIKAAVINTCSLKDGKAILAGIESKIGGAILPMGFAGPAKICGEYVKPEEEIYIPLATNEAALVAGVQRGLKAISLAGGLKTLVHFDGMTRAPLIEAPDIYTARKFINFVTGNKSYIAELQSTVPDPFVRLDDIECYQLGTKVFLRLIFKTGDAMGMNGVTKASAEICRYILAKNPQWKLLTISSNLCTDKKNAHINVLHGRGKSVQTEVFLSNEVLAKVFKPGVNGRSVEKVVFHKCYLGSNLSGTLSGFNVNAANAVAAFYAATGQDMAHVISSSSCFVQADEAEGGLHFMVSLPCMELATIGGGVMFGTAREALELLGCTKYGKSVDENVSVKRLAEIAAAVVTALDLNTACAQAAGYEMADSHVKLARGEK
ncbi:hydroxymethylglutaryl-CoA reductase (NADPH) [Spirochaetia bacterium]|nr:hydroxymethylglutaryl-CoA reductase (NADPH) [Spirochaetia bacterium]